MDDPRDLIDASGEIIHDNVIAFAYRNARIAAARYNEPYEVALRDALPTAWARAHEVQAMW